MEKFVIRELQEKDMNEFLCLLEELNSYKCDREKFRDVLSMQNKNFKTYVLCIEKDGLSSILCTITLVIDIKFYQNIARIEDVVTKKEYRGLGYASKLLKHILGCIKKEDTYKVVLNCSNKNVGFYTKNGFFKKGNEMCLYL
jgi:glucosamine-phosphate N-acetyltransferase